MIHSKAIDVLKTFSKEELKQFSDFVSSPFHNTNKNLIKLFDVLKRYHPEFIVENEKIYTKVYQGKPYNHDNMKKLMSELLHLCDNFLSLTGISKNEFIKEKFLLNELLSRKSDDYLLLNMKRIEKALSEKRYSNFSDKAEFEDIRIDYYLSRNLGLDTSEFSNKKFKYDTFYFMFQLFEYLNSTTSLKNTYNCKNINSKIIVLIESIDFDTFLNDSESFKEDDQMLYMLINLIKMNLNPENESYFFQAKKIFLDYLNSNEIGYDCFAYFAALTGYCARKIRIKKFRFLDEQFDFFKNRFLFISRLNDDTVNITWNDFISTIYIGLSVDEVQWIEEFIIKSKKHIIGKDYEHLYNYGKGSVQFYKGNYEKALEYFSRIHSKEYLFNVSLRNQTLMCYYELDLFEAAISGIDSFIHLINQSAKFNLRNKSLSRYFIDIYKELIKLKLNPDKINGSNINKIVKMLEAKEFNQSDKWISKKLNELNLLFIKNKKVLKAYKKSIP